MDLSSFNKVKDVKDLKDLRTAVAQAGTETTLQLMSDMNLVLGSLPDAGFEVSAVQVDMGLAPRVTISVKLGAAVNEARMKSLQEKTNNAMLTGILKGLVQANAMRDAVSLETLALEDIEVEMTMPPKVSMHWRQRVRTKTAAA